MNATLPPDDVFDVARDVRSWALEYASSCPIFHTATNRERARRTLQGLCGIASFELWKRLTPTGRCVRVVFCDGHVLADVRDGEQLWYVDVTATQFSELLPTVWICDSLALMQSLVLRYGAEYMVEAAYRPRARAKSLRGIAKNFDQWTDDEVHPDLIGQRRKRSDREAV